ncbi:MAG: hypothetical protein IT503_09505 [Burkholderiaceae bacterium]|nr:MAG: hypothetical protein F9K36_07865 [Burkholderiaceae bacterium]MBE7426817.1 hypothetical protein [Ideonella sp.]MCC7286407.1 hypothetical protein [Burkholderiaceae bacterium]
MESCTRLGALPTFGDSLSIHPTDPEPLAGPPQSCPTAKPRLFAFRVRAAAARGPKIIVNGKRAPGQYASGFLALNETWRLEK